MYKTLAVTIPAGANVSDPVQIPGQPIGYSFAAPDFDPYGGFQIRTPSGGYAALYVNNTELLGRSVANAEAYVSLPPTMPRHGVTARISLSLAQGASVVAYVYYEDTPYL